MTFLGAVGFLLIFSVGLGDAYPTKKDAAKYWVLASPNLDWTSKFSISQKL